jgi:glycosyltransferase involved in cell wall biosynthesis
LLLLEKPRTKLRGFLKSNMNRLFKVAFIGNIYSQCGIATYNEQLYLALKKMYDVRFFAEKNGQTSDEINYCWSRNEFPKLDLIDAVDAYKPDIVLFSHEYGIFPKAYYFTNLVSYFKLKSYKVVSIFHSVYELHKDKLVTESICKNVVVHSEEAKQALIRKGLNQENIHVVHHGCSFGDSSNSILPKLWNHLGNNHVILQTGFLFNYKNHLGMLDVIAEVKKEFPDVLYLIVASENPKCQSEHDALYAQLIEKINNLNLNHNVVIDRGFVSHEVLMSYIRTSTVVVLPYKPGPDFDVYAASGMARIVLQTSTPLLVSHANLFSGLDDTVLKLNDLNEWVKAISDIFNQKNNPQKMIEDRKLFISSNSWNSAAAKLYNVFLNAK